MQLQELIKEANKEGKKIYVMFVDIKKCFDRTNHSLIIRTMEAMGFPERFISFLRMIYQRNMASILVSATKSSDPFEVGIGVKQGCNFSPHVLTRYRSYHTNYKRISQNTRICR